MKLKEQEKSELFHHNIFVLVLKYVRVYFCNRVSDNKDEFGKTWRKIFPSNTIHTVDIIINLGVLRNNQNSLFVKISNTVITCYKLVTVLMNFYWLRDILKFGREQCPVIEPWRRLLVRSEFRSEIYDVFIEMDCLGNLSR